MRPFFLKKCIMSDIIAERIGCFRDTRVRARAMPPPPASVKLTDLPPLEQPRSRVPVRVEQMDPIDCGIEYLRKGRNPVVLNLADDCWPGGKVEAGADAQEESLFRRTNLCTTLTLASRVYPIRDNELVYSPEVSVLKSSDATALEPPFDKLAFISCPGLKLPKLVDGRLRPEDEERLRVKVRLIMRCAAQKEHDVVVLGALGCGEWKSPAPHVAEVFSGVLAEPEFRDHFSRIVFAVPCDYYDVFASQFIADKN